MVFHEPDLNRYECIQHISSFSKDIQENCSVPQPIPGEKKTIILNASFYGYETKENLEKALLILKNDPVALKKFRFQKYKEGKSYINASIDSKEQYLFYNCL